MAIERLEVRLDRDRRRKLAELASEQGTAISETVRRLIDEAYEQVREGRRRQAAQELVQLQIEGVPDPGTVSRQLEDTYEPGDLH